MLRLLPKVLEIEDVSLPIVLERFIYRFLQQKQFWIYKRTKSESCSSNGTISYNWRLILMPEPVMDYVVVHELCHLLEMNHTSRFWGLVESMIPNYTEYRAWLKKNGSYY